MAPEPYYSDDRASLYLGDALDVLPQLSGYDLIVTDPPFGVGWRSGRRSERFDGIVGDDGPYDPRPVLGAALRGLRPFRHVYIFGRFDLSGLSLSDGCELTWDKDQVGPGDLSSPWGPSSEPIQFRMFIPSKANRDRGDGRLSARLRRGSVLRVPRLNATAVKSHPTEKPVLLLRQLIESSSLIGETVLDPFAGSGSTLVAAVLEGRKAIGIEIEERYAEVAAKRLEVERGS